MAPRAGAGRGRSYGRQHADGAGSGQRRLGEVFTPGREEIRRALLDLVPAGPDEPFTAVELGCGQGWLSESLLERFRRARVVGLDGSEVMLAQARARLAPFGDRAELRPFRLEEAGWLPPSGGCAAS